MNNIKNIRKDKNISGSILGEKIGYTQSYISRLENCKRDLSYDDATLIADALNCSLVSLNKEIKSNTLDECRYQIDKIDKEMARLFNERMKVVDNIIKYKQANNIQIEDKSRESIVVKKNSEYIDNECLKFYLPFLKNLISISKQYQNEKIKS